jgi:eukaryotic-like serine/threonine-protein kinase
MDIEWLGPYQIVGTLGRGGMGTVYEGVHRDTGEPAAVKLLSAALAQESGFRTRFEGEIETLRKLNHPHIVRLFGFGEQDGHLFYAMELVDGNSLEEELRQGRCFDWREVARFGIQISRALRHAHDRGVIHRDLKPGNLLLAADGQVKLSDFGIARLFGNTRLTQAGNVLGTAEYMSPEQADGRPVDVRSDLYSLGAVMYALLARRPLFRGKSLVEVLHKQRFDEPEPLQNFAPDTPEKFQRILNQLLEKAPERRIPNASLLGRRLDEMLHVLGVSDGTLAAGADWFTHEDVVEPALLPGEPKRTAEPEPLADDLPATQELPSKTRLPEQTLPTASALPAPAERVPTKIDIGRPTTRGHFVPVTEKDLDRVEAEPHHPALGAWQTWALAGTLLAIGLATRWFLQPPTAVALYGRITAETTDAAMKSIVQAQEAQNDINEFVNRYADDPRIGKVRAAEKQVDLYRAEWKFDQHVKGRMRVNGLLPIERMYLEAIGHARLNPTLAMTKLQALLDLYNQPGDETGATGQCLIVARRRLAQLRTEVDKFAADQLAVLREHLKAADAMRQTDPQQARIMYRAVVELYADKPWAAEAVHHARESLQKLPAQKP